MRTCSATGDNGFKCRDVCENAIFVMTVIQTFSKKKLPSPAPFRKRQRYPLSKMVPHHPPLRQRPWMM